MQRRWQETSSEDRDAPAWFDKVELAVESNPGGGTHALEQVEQVHATPQEDVLAVVDRLRLAAATGERVGGGPATEEIARLQQGDVKSSAGQRCRTRHPRQATADDYPAGHSGREFRSFSASASVAGVVDSEPDTDYQEENVDEIANV